MLQRATDWGFVRALAAKWGYAAYLESGPGGRRATSTRSTRSPTPQGELPLGFGGDAGSVSVEAQLTGGQRVMASRMPPLSDAPQHGEAAGDDEAQGARTLGGQATVLLAPTDVDGEIDPRPPPRAWLAVGVRHEAAVQSTQRRPACCSRAAHRAGQGPRLGAVGPLPRAAGPPSSRSGLTRVTRIALGLVGDEPFGGGGLLL